MMTSKEMKVVNKINFIIFFFFYDNIGEIWPIFDEMLLNRESSESEYENEDLEKNDFPGFTQWRRVKYCCTNNAVYIDKMPNVIFLGHWDAQLGFPIAVTTIIVSSYLVGMILIFPAWRKIPGIIMATILSITFFLFIYSYFRIIIDGPGYLPFYWPLKHNKDQNPDNLKEDNEMSSFINKNEELSPSGIISTKEQLEWVKDRPRPNRSILSTDGHRIVIRPDHFCGWTASWIGKRNYKFFLLFNFWGAVYILNFLVCCIIQIVDEMSDDTPSPSVAILFVYAFLALTFLLMTGSFACTHTYQMFLNTTNWEEWKGIDNSRFDRGCSENITDVCGPWSKWYTFLLPISPWTSFTNDELVKDYPPYKSNRY